MNCTAIRCLALISIGLVEHRYSINAGDAAAQTPLIAAPEGWETFSARDEIRPAFSFDPSGGPEGKGSLAISTDGREGPPGHWASTFPVRADMDSSFRRR